MLQRTGRSGALRAASIISAATLAAVGLAAPGQAFAWGHTGHVGISELAAEALPREVPGFLRSPLAVAEISQLGAEADESKTTGTVTGVANGRISTTFTVHDAERDPGHFIDLDDTGVVVGGAVPLTALPTTREAFDTAQRAATNPGHQDQYASGYLPYEIMDDFQQVRKDFGMWRAFGVGLRTARSRSDREYFAYQLALREQLIIRDIGYWSHFVADGSQPLHVSVHFNGWGNFPNPNGFTTAPIHAQFEGAFVKNFINFNAVRAQVRPYTDRGVTTIEARVPLYLAETLSQVPAVYQAAKANNNDNYQTPQPAEVAVVTRQLAAGVAELRDEIVDAWRQSEDVTVGFPLVTVKDIEAGRVAVTPDTFGSD